MNISVIKLFSVRSALVLACLSIAGCNLEKKWQDEKAYVTVSGVVTGITSGSVQLVNNGKDQTTVSSNGSFQFSLSIANNSGYAVSVSKQPGNLSCAVSNGIGIATSDVSNVSVICSPYSFNRRPLPDIYSTGKAVNYSPYRTSAGPAIFEVPTDAEILEDLALLNDAGYNLLRLFGAAPPATDVVSEKILQLANANYPNIKFQLGVFLGGLTTCSDPVNDKNVAYLITKLSKYPNVVSISVGNETSFYSKYMDVECLGGYIKTIRAQVTQPVTADDDWTFYAGLSWSGGDRSGFKPDTILPLLDFAAIHLYPFSNPSWDWQQQGTAAGAARAQKTMEASLNEAKKWFNLVATYSFDDNGQIKTIAEAMPIVVGETGWKARQTNYASTLESYLAKPANAKWYFDLLYGNSAKGYLTWEGSESGPTTIFYFEAFDETWKRADDGWGLWDINRQPRYALCDVVSSNPCNADLYQDAGFFDIGSVTAPTTAPSTVIPSESVVVYSDASVTTGLDSCPNWGQSTVCIPEQTIAGNNFIGYTKLNYQGLEWVNNPVDASSKSTLHIDFWTPDLLGIDVYLISINDGVATENAVLQVLTPGNWASADIPLSLFNADKSAIKQIKLVASGGGTVYVDNIYFYGSSSSSSSSSSVDSSSSISSSSSSSSVASSSNISSSSSSAASTPSTAPSTAIPSGSVVVYSDASVTTGFDSCPIWGQATVCIPEQTIAGNKLIGYSNLNYQGLDWSNNPIDVSAKTTLHVDFWTPNLTSIQVSLISAGPVENAYNQVLTTGGWNSVDIPLSNYRADKSAIRQIKLVATGGGTVYVDNIYFYGSGSSSSSSSSSAASAPTTAPSTVIPSGAVKVYTDAAVTTGFDSCPRWGQATVCIPEQTIAGNKVLGYSNLNYQGLGWTSIDVSAKATLHVDFWTPNLTSIQVSLISIYNGVTKENPVTKPLTPNAWNRIDIPLSDYVDVNKTYVRQIKLEASGGGTVYVDNIYFY